MGRELDPLRFSIADVAPYLNFEIFEEERERADKLIWSICEINDYIAEEVVRCGEVLLSVNEKKPGVYFDLKEVDSNLCLLGSSVGVRYFQYSPELLGFRFDENRSGFLSISKVNLHPSLCRKGFLSGLIYYMKSNGFLGLAFENILNPSLAFYLYQKIQSDKGIFLLSDESTVDFKNKISPGPTFGVVL